MSGCDILSTATAGPCQIGIPQRSSTKLSASTAQPAMPRARQCGGNCVSWRPLCQCDVDSLLLNFSHVLGFWCYIKRFAVCRQHSSAIIGVCAVQMNTLFIHNVVTLRRSAICSPCCLRQSFASLLGHWTCTQTRRGGATGASPSCWVSSVQVRSIALLLVAVCSWSVASEEAGYVWLQRTETTRVTLSR